MRPEEPLLPDESSDLPSPSSSLDPSEEEALLRHLSRYQARKVRRRQGNRLLAVGTVVAGAAVIIVVVALARSPGPVAPPSVATPAAERDVPEGRTISPPAVQPERTVTATAPVVSATPSGRETTATTAAPAPPTATPPAPTPVAPPPPATSAPAMPPSPRLPAPAAPSSPPAPGIAAVAYQPRDRLTLVKPGDSKDKVFDRFGTTFERRGGSVVRVDGMRLRASGRSPRHAHVEVAEVTLADAAAGHVHWFLFGDGRLLAWGRPAEWPAAVQRHEIEIDYSPTVPSGR